MADSATDQAELDTEVTEPEGADEEPQLDPEVAARRASALAHVKKFGEPVLRTRSRPVERFDTRADGLLVRPGRRVASHIAILLDQRRLTWQRRRAPTTRNPQSRNSTRPARSARNFAATGQEA